MFNLLMTSTVMKFLPLTCLSLLTRSGPTFADEHGPVIIFVTEGSDAILPCSLSIKENIMYKHFEWKKDGQKEVFFHDEGIHSNNSRPGQDQQFKGRVSHFSDELKYGNASIIIRNTKVTDSGNYTCIFPLLQPRQIFHIQLVVGRILKDRTGENIPGAASKPCVNTLNETKDGVLLQCKVRSPSPKPTVEWQDSAGNKLPAEEPQVSERRGRFYISLNTTVTKTDRYRCVATQEEIKHQIYTETYVYIHGVASKPSVTTLHQTKYSALLQCEVRGASPKPTVEWQDSAGNKLPAEETQVSERGGRYDIILQTTVNKTDHFRCVATQDINHQIYSETYMHIYESPKQFPIQWIVAAVLNGVLVVALAVLVVKCCIVKVKSKGDNPRSQCELHTGPVGSPSQGDTKTND